MQNVLCIDISQSELKSSHQIQTLNADQTNSAFSNYS